MDGLFGEGGHNGITSLVGMKTVFTQFPFEEAFVVNHGGEIVEIDEFALDGIFLDPFVEGENFYGRAAIGHDDPFAG